MATQSHVEKEEKHQQGEVPGGPKNEAAHASGDECSPGNHEPAATVPAVSSDASPSGVLSSSPADSAAAAAILIADEDPGLPSMACVQAKRCSDLQGSHSPHVDLRCVVSETAGLAAVEPPPKGTGQPGGRPAQTKSPGKNRRRKQPRRDQAAQARKFPGSRLFPAAPSSRHSQASRWSDASRPGPALRSQAARPGPDRHSQASEPSPGRRRRSCTTLPGPALRRRASDPAPAIQSRATPPGPAVRRRTCAPGPAPRSQGSPPGPARRSRAILPDPALSGIASGPGPTRQSRSTPPGRVLRSSTARSSPIIRSTITTPGPVLQRCSARRRSTLLSRRALPGSADGNSRSPPGFALRSLVFGSNRSSPDPEVPSLASQPSWHAVRMRASSPSPPGRFYPILNQRGESCSSCSSSSPRRSSSSSSSSSPKFFGLSSIPTPSPDSLRRALLPELDSLSSVCPEEQADLGSTPHPPTPPVL
uniref:EZH inhibitory protein n=1 Tax=Propithecus coquereli TaxID=379532 RepID=A0A2K6FE79_PROCO